jgi:hypothetical protein
MPQKASFIFVFFLLSHLSAKSQTTKYIGLEGFGLYAIPEFSIIETSPEDNLIFGGQVYARISFGKKEKTSLNLGFGFFSNEVSGDLKTELFGLDEDGMPYRARFNRQYLIYKVLFGWEPLSLRRSKLRLAIGPSAVIFVSESGSVFTNDFALSRGENSDDLIPGAMASLAFESMLGVTNIGLRVHLSHTQFLSSNSFKSVSEIGLGLIWQIPKPKGNGIF